MKRHQVHSDQPLTWAERCPADHMLSHSCHTVPGLGILLCETKPRRSRGRWQEPCEGPRMRYERLGSGAQTLRDRLQPLQERSPEPRAFASLHQPTFCRQPESLTLRTYAHTGRPHSWPHSYGPAHLPGAGGGSVITSPTQDEKGPSPQRHQRAGLRPGRARGHGASILHSNPNTASESLAQLRFLSEAGPDHQISKHKALE